MRNRRFPPVSLKKATCRTTDMTSIIYTTPTIAMNSGSCSIYPHAATKPPSASEPVSPMNTAAGYTLKRRTPSSAPATALVTGSSPLPVPAATAVKKTAAKKTVATKKAAPKKATAAKKTAAKTPKKTTKEQS